MTKPVPSIEISDQPDGAIAMLVLSLEQLTTVRRALERYSSIRDPEVDPKRIAEKLAAMIEAVERIER